MTVPEFDDIFFMVYVYFFPDFFNIHVFLFIDFQDIFFNIRISPSFLDWTFVAVELFDIKFEFLSINKA